MKTYVLYTTSKSSKIQREANVFATEISQTKGRGEIKIDVKHIKPPSVIDTYTNVNGYTLPSWIWFRSWFAKENYDGVIFHCSSYYRRKWGIKSGKDGFVLGGVRNHNNKEYPEFCVFDDLEDDYAKGYEGKHTLVEAYPITNFLRKMFHEHAHFDEDLDDSIGNVLTQTSVHTMDYELKQIHLYHLLIDYRGKAIKEQLNKLINMMFKLVKQVV